MDSRRKEEALTISKLHKILTKTMLASNVRRLYNRICQWYEIENQVLTPRAAEDEEQIDLELEQLTLIAQKQQTMPQATGDSLLHLTLNHETLIRKASEQAACARTVEIGQFYITNEAVMGGNSSLLFTQKILRTNKFSKFEITNCSHRSCQDWTSAWN